MLLAVSYAFIALHGPGGISPVLEKQRQLHDLQRVNAQLKREVADEKKFIEDLKNNPATLEKEIRDKLKLTRPDEKIYITGPQQ